MIATCTTMTSMVRLIVIAIIARSGDAARQRPRVIDDIGEEIDIYE